MNAAYQTYRQTQAQTAAPGELIVMLYRGAARFVASGIEGIEADNVEMSHNYLVRAQAVINELLESIDVERGGEVARNLWRIYDYMNSCLVEANLRKDAVPAREVERLLRELLPAWEEAARQTNAQPARQTVRASA
jgi:flagellar protein FliS